MSSLAIQALRAIGKDKVGPKAEEKIISLLKQEPMKILEHDIALAPMWIQKIMSKALPDVID